MRCQVCKSNRWTPVKDLLTCVHCGNQVPWPADQVVAQPAPSSSSPSPVEEADPEPDPVKASRTSSRKQATKKKRTTRAKKA